MLADSAGEFVAVADLLVVGTRHLAEDDGADHRGAHQHAKDLARDKEIARLGWDRFGYTAVEILRDPHRFVQDAQTALGLQSTASDVHQRLGRWRHEVELSSLSAAGRRRLAHRMRRFQRSESPRRHRRPLQPPT